MTPRVAWVCEAGPDIGWGHVQRGLTMAEVSQGSFALVVGRGYDVVRDHVARVAPTVQVRIWSGPSAPAESDLGDADVVVLDHYSIEAASLRSPARRVAIMDDWVRADPTADALINANLGATRDDYAGGSVRRWALGATYALVRRAFREASPHPLREGAPRAIMLTFGGSDPFAVTAAVAERLRETDWFRSGGAMDVVLGRSYGGPQPWVSWPVSERARLRPAVDPPDFADRCAAADLIVVAGGTSVYELACLGRPFVPVAHSANNRRIVKAFAAAGMGSGPVVGEGNWLEQVARDIEEWARDGAARNAAARAAHDLVDGLGAFRVRDFLGTLTEGTGT